MKHDITKMTAQQVFDVIAGHLLRQNAKSMDGDICAYRSPEGLSCAAGFLLTDEEANALDQERGDWAKFAKLGCVPPDHSDLIRELQRVHDRFSLGRWTEELSRVADTFGLTFNPGIAK